MISISSQFSHRTILRGVSLALHWLESLPVFGQERAARYEFDLRPGGGELLRLHGRIIAK